ncbi:MAG: hypothetical protein E6K18_08135 [Methanobacteriota archaeon]|nr:MAG: hypothetical protein E6K18_08135 [Euryarchaeota archaeon]
MATEFTELVDLANGNLLRERADAALQTDLADAALQTDLDSWAERAELEQALTAMLPEIDITSEPRNQVDVVSFGPAAVLGFLAKKGPTDERIIFS